MRDALQIFMDSFPSVIALLDKEGVVRRVNRAWQAFAADNAASQATCAGVGENYFSVCHAAAADGDTLAAVVLGGIQQVLAGTSPRFCIEYPCDAPGQQRWFSMEALPLGHSLPDEPGRLIVVHRDISAGKQAESVMQEARLIAEEASKAKTIFLTSMSHELRTPLNSIIGFAQLLSQERVGSNSLSPEQKDAARHILASGRLLHQLIGEVLDLARVESGKLDLRIESVTVAPLIREVLALSRPAAVAHGVAFRQDIDDSLAVSADPLRLKQILLNLVSNAVKYNRDNGLVLLTTRQEGACVRISVADTGPGIPVEQHARLFRPFERLGAELTAIEGTGIGLTICKRLAEAMQGTIGLTSRIGNGSCFWVDLPAALPEMQMRR